MQLEYQYFGGEGKPVLIVLHGLLGSSRNWVSVCKELVQYYEVFALDLRNHGKSPHADEMSYTAMAADLNDFIQQKRLTSVHLLGHSMGGKTVMRYAVDHPHQVKSLIIEDMVPKVYQPHHSKEFEAMNALDLGSIQTRKQADAFLQQWISNWAQRQFLLTNLVRGEHTHYKWAINLKALTENAHTVCKNPLHTGDYYMGPTLLIAGSDSDFVQLSDLNIVKKHFPRHTIQFIEGAGHNVHVDQKQAFLDAIYEFSGIKCESIANRE